MRPIIRITIDRQPISAPLSSRLISVTVTDKEGTRADTIDLEIDAGGPLAAIPRKKALIKCWMGYEGSGVAYMGAFSADEPTLHFLPYRITVQGKSADVRSQLKEHREKHWDGQTFGGVVGELAGDAGLSAQVAPRIAQFKGRDGYFAIEGESPLHYVERMSRRLGGIFSIKDGKLIIADKNAGQTPGGGVIGTLVVTPPMVIKGTGSVTFSSREQFKKVRAGYHDTGEAKRQWEEADGDPEAEAGTHTIRHQFANKDEAKAAADAKAKDLKREAKTTSVTIEGNTGARGGAPMVYAGIHPGVDGQSFIIETATHHFTKGGGYTTQISAKSKV